MFTEINVEGKRVGTYGIDYLKSENDVYLWVLDNNQLNSLSGGYWDKLRSHMTENTASLKFDVNGYFKVDITKDSEPTMINAILDNFSGKLKFKKWAMLAPWVVVLQEYLMDTDWSKKEPAMSNKKGRGGILDMLKGDDRPKAYKYYGVNNRRHQNDIAFPGQGGIRLGTRRQGRPIALGQIADPGLPQNWPAAIDAYEPPPVQPARMPRMQDEVGVPPRWNDMWEIREQPGPNEVPPPIEF
jgi:hypothetical protein